MRERPRAYNLQQVIENDNDRAIEKARRQPLSACFETIEGGSAGRMNVFYRGHVPIDELKKEYTWDCRIVYERGWENEPITRVSWGAVEPKLTMDIKE